ncbi:MAG: LysM peptidoglycan-binding domain-containing protein [Firmicutes bacterium]|nr:LysM peptidoglycan-binding domain-containing protein [Bacillota bacterium]
MAEVIYKVERGDNLTKIAKAYNTTVADLVKWNGIKNPNLIFVGQEIKIQVPDAAASVAPAPAAPAVPTQIYKIAPGDNLTKIAKQFGTTVDELVKLNNIANPNLIFAGADLKVPVSAEAQKAAAEAAAAKAAAEKAAAEAAAKAAAEKAAAEAAAKAEADKVAAQEAAIAAAKAAAQEAAIAAAKAKAQEAAIEAAKKAAAETAAKAAAEKAAAEAAAKAAAQDVQTAVKEEKATFGSKLASLFKK